MAGSSAVSADVVSDEPAHFFIDLTPQSDEDIYIPYYNRADEGVLGLEDEEHAKPFDLSLGCWNCGSTEHTMNACTAPRDPARINAARAAWREREPASNTSNLRLHESEAALARQMSFIDRFRPGTISQELRWALGFSPWSTDFPYLRQFLVWGYPPAYYVREGAATPQERMKARLLSNESEQWELVDLLKMEEELAGTQDNISTTAAYTPSPRKGLRQADPNAKLVKSVRYETSLFDSDRLPCCWPDRLPDLIRDDDPTPTPRPTTTRIPTPLPPAKVPPWRLPGAWGLPASPVRPLRQTFSPALQTHVKRQRVEHPESVEEDMECSD